VLLKRLFHSRFADFAGKLYRMNAPVHFRGCRMTAPAAPFDVHALREDFPILAQEHHPGVPLVYLDNAASSQKPRPVLDAMDRYYRETNANVHRGIHKLSEAATEAYEGVRGRVRLFINARKKKEIIFTRGTTEGLNLIAQTWGRAHVGQGDVIVSTVMEHHSNIVPWQMLAAEKGARVLYVPVLADMTLDLAALDRFLRDEPVKLVTVTAVSNVLGTVNPIRTIADKAHAAGAVLAVDAAQAVPHFPLDVQAWDADFVVFSGHKMFGPTGSGVLYGRQALLEAMPPWMGGGDMISRVTLEASTWNELPYKFEAGTPSIAEVIGLGAAVDYLTALGMDRVHAHDHAITTYALERLSEVSGLTLLGSDPAVKSAVAAFTLEGVHAHDVAQLLDGHGIAVRAGHHCAQPLHDVLGTAATARASFAAYTTPDEIDRLVEGLEQVKRVFAGKGKA
jgi:cysteine desulfurase/selenocysteine lyase